MRLFKFIQRKRALGDVLWIEPVVRRIAQDYYHVVVITPYAALFDNYPLKNVHISARLHPLLKVVRELSKTFFKSAGFLDLDRCYEQSPAMHILQAYLIKAGHPNEPLSYPRLYLSDHERRESQSGGIVLMHVASASTDQNHRTIAGVDWVAIKNHLEKKQFRVIGITEDHSQSNWYTTHCSPNLRELIALVNHCALFIGADSGPSHIAAALKKPSIIFFGAVNPAYRHLQNDFNGTIMQQSCIHAGCYHTAGSTASKRCQLVDNTSPAPCCIFSTQELIAAIDRQLVSAKTAS